MRKISKLRRLALSLWLVLSIIAGGLLVACGKDEPDFPKPFDDNELTLEERERDFWGDEKPHWFCDHIDTLIVNHCDADGFLWGFDGYHQTNIWKISSVPSADITLWSRNRINPVTDPGRYVEICRQMGCRPRSSRVNISEIAHLPQFNMGSSPVIDTLANVDVIALNDFNDEISAGDNLNKKAQIYLSRYQDVIHSTVKNGNDSSAPYSAMSYNFYSSQLKMIYGGYPYSMINVVIWGKPKSPGVYSFKVIVSFKNQESLETVLKIRFE